MNIRLKYTKILVVSLLLFLSNTKASCQNLSQTYQFGLQAYEQQNYAAAINAYERVVFFDDADSLRPQVYYQLAQCYYNVQNYPKAQNYYDLAYNLAVTDSQKTQFTLSKVSCLLAQKDASAALTELYSIDENMVAKPFQKKIRVYYGICFFALKDFEKSQAFFLKAATDTATKIAIKNAFIRVKATNEINPKTAQWLSTFVPGLGQLYAGDLKNGLNSIALTALLAAWAGNIAQNNRPIDAILTVYPWFQRYYNGGRKHAFDIAKQAVSQRQYVIYIDILNAIAFDNALDLSQK